MAETKKRSEELAVENVRRITEMLRTERNDAIALAQVKREEAGRYRNMIKEARKLLELAQGAAPADLGERIRAFIISLPPDTAG